MEPASTWNTDVYLVKRRAGGEQVSRRAGGEQSAPREERGVVWCGATATPGGREENDRQRSGTAGLVPPYRLYSRTNTSKHSELLQRFS